MNAIIDVIAFIDWQSQLHNFATVRLSDPRKQGDVTLRLVWRAVGILLKDEAPKSTGFRVTFRLYHGWHVGKQPTARRLALLGADLRQETIHGRIWLSSVAFGDRLLAASDDRLVFTHAMLRVHLPDTLRSDGVRGNMREKMVDTALAADVLAHARSSPRDWRLVLAEDDDLVPPLLVADAWSRPHARNLLVRRGKVNKLLPLQGLCRELPHVP